MSTSPARDGDDLDDCPYRYKSVWRDVSEHIRNEAVRFWMRETSLPIEEALSRSRQLLMIASDRHGDIVAVSTAVPVLVESLGFKCFYYRTLVGSADRCCGLKSHQIAKQLLVRSYRLLDTRFAAGHDPDVLGLYMEIENPKVMRIRNEAIWNSSGIQAVYIGKTLPHGRHCRVCYFDAARIT